MCVCVREGEERVVGGRATQPRRAPPRTQAGQTQAHVGALANAWPRRPFVITHQQQCMFLEVVRIKNLYHITPKRAHEAVSGVPSDSLSFVRED